MEITKTTPGNSVNETKGHAPHHYSKFPLTRRRYQTMRFGELTPHLAMQSVGKDILPLHSSHDIRSYTLKAPLMSNLSMKKDYFSVPLQCILPLNADKIITNPTLGDDVSVNVNGVVDGKVFFQSIQRIYNSMSTDISNSSDGTDIRWDNILRHCIILEYFLSSGSLVRQLAYSFSQCFQPSAPGSFRPDVHNFFDWLFEEFLSHFKDDIITNSGGEFQVRFYPEPTLYLVNLSSDYSNGFELCWHDFLERARQNPLFEFAGAYTDVAPYAALKILVSEFQVVVPSDFEPINFNMVSAYQIVCHHFYSNDFIDYIYSAELFRQLMRSYIEDEVSINGDPVSFSWNGVSLLFDELSGYWIDIMLSQLSTVFPTGNQGLSSLDAAGRAYFNYVSSLFTFRRSLRYVDYFTGARSAAIAVGNTDVAVVSSKVSVIDIVHTTQATRFLNFVQRTGRKVAEYAKNLLGIDMPYDYHNPMMLAHTSDEVRGIENENTGAAQLTHANSVTSVFRSNADRYMFEYHNDLPFTYVIGITYFDIPRAWAFSNDKIHFQSDRYDMFNPFMELTGDQPISAAELGALATTPFGYVQKYMEYKQTFDIACGGFVDYLPGWSFTGLLEDIPGRNHISPDFIRSHNFELDRFYLALSGDTLASYFHFIVANTNYIDAKRPMTNDPKLL